MVVPKSKACNGAPEVTLIRKTQAGKFHERQARVRKATRKIRKEGAKSLNRKIVCAKNSEYLLRDYGNKKRRVVGVENPTGKLARDIKPRLKKNGVIVTQISEINKHHAEIGRAHV